MAAGKETRYLETTAADGSEIRVPLASATGACDGPTLAVIGGVHGSEYAGIEAVRQIFQWLEPEQLSGRVLTIPCLNIPAFYAFAAHVNPVDGENPARAFPGSAEGSYTERMVHLAWEHVVSQADYVVDVHGGDIEEELVDYSQINLNGDPTHDAAAEALARALDMPFFVRRAAPAEPVRSGGTICQIASGEGRPAVLAESGSHGELNPACVEVHTKGLRNVLYHLEMLPGEPTIEHDSPTMMYGFAGIAAPVDGLWYPAVKKGDSISKGQLVGEMRDFFGNALSDVYSDENAAILGVMTVLARGEGEMLMGIGTFE